jgi:hypothetical protein
MLFPLHFAGERKEMLFPLHFAPTPNTCSPHVTRSKIMFRNKTLEGGFRN